MKDGYHNLRLQIERLPLLKIIREQVNASRRKTKAFKKTVDNTVF